MGEVGINAIDGPRCHLPVLPKEVMFWLRPRDGFIFLDCTVGYCGHSKLLLEATAPNGKVIGIDRDPQAIAAGKAQLALYGQRLRLVRGNFVDLKRHLSDQGVSKVHGVLFDLGVSSPQLDEPARGFSFRADGPLDMRMDPSGGMTAADMVNQASEADLADMIYRLGEERYSRRIARAIVRARADRPFTTTGELAEVIESSVPSFYRRGRIHCATRTFQALRIAVNGELEGLASSLRDAAGVLIPGGRICAISFHSLEDRIVKHTFRSLAQGPDACLSLLTKRPVMPAEEECRVNPRARSAKLRVAERLPERVVS